MEYKLAYVAIVCCLLVHMSLIGNMCVFFHLVNEDGALTYSQVKLWLTFFITGCLDG